jgi:flagellar protein FlbB
VISRYILILLATASAVLMLQMTPLEHLLHAADSEKKPAEATAKDGKAGKDAKDAPPPNPSRAAREEKAIQDARRQQLAEKEAALAAKEQELKKMGDKLDAQIKALDDSKKKLDESTKAQKKAQDEKTKKMLGMFKKMKAEQAGELMDKLDETKVIALLNQMDTKTAIKLIPYLKQPRVLKWINENLKGV